jgi:hypothetical protein
MWPRGDVHQLCVLIGSVILKNPGQTSFSIFSGRRYNCELSVPVYLTHEAEMDYFLLKVILHDAKGSYPQVLLTLDVNIPELDYCTCPDIDRSKDAYLT